MRTSHRILIHAVVAAVALAAGSSFAQQTTGTPGSPSATTTIPGEQIPAPPQKFGGAIKDTAPQSTILQAAGVKQPMAVDGIKQGLQQIQVRRDTADLCVAQILQSPVRKIRGRRKEEDAMVEELLQRPPCRRQTTRAA